MSLLDYIKGERSGKNAHQLELDAMRDPFLQDAMDGYDLINDHPVYHLKKLEKQIKKRTRKKQHYVQIWVAAACIVLLFCVSVYFYAYENKDIPAEGMAIAENRSISAGDYNHTIDSLAQEKSTRTASNGRSAGRSDTKKNTDGNSQPSDFSESAQEVTDYVNANGRPGDDQASDGNRPSYESTRYITVSDSEPQALDPPDLSSGVQEAVKIMPKPTVGDKAYNDYITKNRNTVSDDNDKIPHGKVILLFSVNHSGRPEDIAILRSVSPSADKEAIRLLQNGPDWTEGNLRAHVDILF